MLGGILARPGARLRRLSIENNRVDDAGIATMAVSLADNATLRELNLSFSCGVAQAGWRTFAACLRIPSSALEVLDLSSTDIANEGAVALGRALAHNTTLKTLYMYNVIADGMPLITSAGWTAVFAALKNEDSTLEHLDLRYSRQQRQRGAHVRPRRHAFPELLTQDAGPESQQVDWRSGVVVVLPVPGPPRLAK